MKRDFSKLSGTPFDLLVIGGGVYGSWIAYDASLRGLDVALVDKGDWASGTSSASSKLVHGGLRYLEYLHFGLVRKSLRERKLLSRLGPHRVHPLRFVLPLYERGRVGPIRMKLGLALYDAMGGRNQPVAGHAYLSKDKLVSDYDFLDPAGLRCGFTYGDCGTDDARLVVELVSGAVTSGATAVNHAAAVDLIRDGHRFVGAVIEDTESGERIDVHASVTVNAAGAWAGDLLKKSGSWKDSSRLTKGVHLVMPPLPVDDAFLLTSPKDGRVFFIIPWYGRSLLGTTDTDYDAKPDDVDVQEEDIDYLLDSANAALGSLDWNRSHIQGQFVGLRVLQEARGQSASSLTREWVLRETESGLLIPVGGKLTSARVEAARVVDRAMEKMGRPSAQSKTGFTSLPWCPTNYDAWCEAKVKEGIKLGVDVQTMENCLSRYGTSIDELLRVISSAPELAGRIVNDLPFCSAEIVHVVQHEMACTLEDVLRRRVPLGILTKLNRETLLICAEMAGEILGWSPEKRQNEVNQFVSSS